MSVRYEREGPVAWVTIDRPEARNALNEAVRTGLFDAVARFNGDDAAVLVLTGAGDQAFCAGGDLKEMAELALEVPPPDFLPIFGRNVTVDKPTIAAVNGAEQTVVSGVAEAVDAICARLAARGVRCQLLVVSHAFHSQLMEPMLAAFEREVAAVKLAPSSARKGVASPSISRSGAAPWPPETLTCSLLPAGTVAAPPAGSRKIGAAPV